MMQFCIEGLPVDVRDIKIFSFLLINLFLTYDSIFYS